MRDYITLLKCDYSPREINDKYIVNLCDSIEKKLSTLLKHVSRGLVNEKTDVLIKQIIERNFALVYDVLALDDVDQNRINQLIKKIKKEKLNK